jgi:YD repeat-containing protein
MSKRLFATTLLSFLLILPLAGFTNVHAVSSGAPSSSQQRSFETRPVDSPRLPEGTELIKTFDQAGRVETITIAPGKGGGFKFTFKFEYDQQNRLRAMVGEDGSRNEFEYDAKGRLRRAVFFGSQPVILSRDESGKIISSTRETKPAKISSLRLSDSNGNNVAVVKAATPCAVATARAVAAGAFAAVVCISGIGDCQAALDIAAEAAAQAVIVCAEPQALPVENAV